MEKELKIAELASIWGVSVPTTWNRVRKEGLKTVKKIDENKKEIAFVVVSDEILNKYVNNVVNNNNNNVNNRYYEDMLLNNNNNNVVNNDNNQQKTENNTLSAKEIFDRLTTLNNEYNERLQRVNEELITAKSKTLLLEDKASREGLYINEIETLTKDNKRLHNVLRGLISVIVILLLLLTGYVTFNIASNLGNKKTEPEIQAPSSLKKESKSITYTIPQPHKGQKR